MKDSVIDTQGMCLVYHVTNTIMSNCKKMPLTKASDAELWSFVWSALSINGWINNREAGDLRCHCAHYDVIVMIKDEVGFFPSVVAGRPVSTVSATEKLLHIWYIEFWTNKTIFIKDFVNCKAFRNNVKLREKWFVYIALKSHERHGVSIHRSHNCLLSSKFTSTSNTTLKLNPTVTGGLLAQSSTNAESGPMWWRRNDAWYGNVTGITQRLVL